MTSEKSSQSVAKIARATFASAIMAVSVPAALCASSGIFNVRDFGAIGNGTTLETAAINKTVKACAAAGGGQVLFPPGRYLSGTIHLKSHIHLFFESGARLIGTTNLSLYQNPSPSDAPIEARWSKWHRGLILGQDVEDVTIGGTGVLDGNKVFDPTGEERMRGPHTIVFVNCRRFTVRDLSIVDAANYAILFYYSNQVDVRHVKFTGGWDGVHFRGSRDQFCHDVNIIGCQFYTGDDSIAGSYWNNVVVSDCIVNSSCNGIRLIGPATRLIIHDCLFYGPGQQPHRTSGDRRRTNMLSGIILQPSAWDAMEGPLDDVLISDVTMKNVASPVTMWIKKGNTAGRITVSDLRAIGVYRAAFSVESYAETPFTNVVLRDITAEFDGGGTAEQARAVVRSPRVDCRPLPSWGVYARNVDRLSLENVRLICTQDDSRPVLMADRVAQLNLDGFRFTEVTGVDAPLTLTNVTTVTARDPDRDSRTSR